MHLSEEKMNSELETQQSRETSSKETFQKVQPIIANVVISLQTKNAKDVGNI